MQNFSNEGIYLIAIGSLPRYHCVFGNHVGKG